MTINNDQRLSIGSRLRAAREITGQSVQQYARQLKVPSAVLQSIESEQWDRLGAPIYVRNHVRAYAKALNINVDTDLETLITSFAKPELVAMAPSTQLQRFIDLSSRNVAYIAGTLMFVPLVFLAATQLNKPRPIVSAPLDPPPISAMQISSPPLQTSSLASIDSGQMPVPAGDVALPAALADELSDPQVAAEPISTPQTVSAALGSFSAASPASAVSQSAVSQSVIEFSLRDQSWVEIRNRDGRRLVSSLLADGEVGRFPLEDISSLVFGNADAVSLNISGNTVDVEPFRAANVVRIAVSSDGELTADSR